MAYQRKRRERIRSGGRELLKFSQLFKGLVGITELEPAAS